MAVFGHFPAAFQYPLRIAQRLSNSLWAFPSSFPIAFGHFSAAFLYPNSSTQRLSNSLYEPFPAAIG
jgi:hypothetical protein